MCSELANYFFSQDAIPIVNSALNISDFDFTLEVSARGFIEPQDASNKIRFNGEITMNMKEDISTIITDSYSALTGWSTFPEKITLDIMAVNVFSRFQRKFEQLAQ